MVQDETFFKVTCRDFVTDAKVSERTSVFGSGDVAGQHAGVCIGEYLFWWRNLRLIPKVSDIEALFFVLYSNSFDPE